MDNGSQSELSLARVQFGGFVVRKAHNPQMCEQIVFACTEIDDALKFIRAAIKPIGGPETPGVREIMNKLRGEK